MARIVVIGSIGFDEIVHLRTPLRPDAHLQATRAAPRLGGGGANTAVPLALAGHQVDMVSATGDDAASAHVLGELRAAGVDVSMVRRSPGGPTWALILVDPSGERTVINVHRVSEDAPIPGVEDIPADAVFVRSRSRALTPLLERITERRLVLAHVPPAEPNDRPAHILVGSQADLGEAFLADPWKAARSIAGERMRQVVVTRGAAGATAFDPDGAISAPAPHVTSLDRTGAGDAFAAGLVHAMVTGRPTAEALAVACAWGAEAVRTPASVLPAETVRRLVRAHG